MKTIVKIIPIIIILIIIGFIASANVLILAADTSEGGESAPGMDMAATWSLSKGFNCIYPGSSTNAEGETLHNIHYDHPDSPYQAAADIMEYTYHTRPNLVITVNNAAAERIFGGSIVDNIRGYDWGEGYDRAPAIQAAMENAQIDYLAVISSVLSGDIAFHFV